MVVYESTAVGVSAATGWSLGAIAGAGAIVVGSAAAVGTDIYLGVELYKTNQGVNAAEYQAAEAELSTRNRMLQKGRHLGNSSPKPNPTSSFLSYPVTALTDRL